VFSRDLLQAEVTAPDGKPLHVLVNHLNSNFIADEFRLTADQVAAEKKAIATRRTQQADAITAILRRQRLSRRIVVLGDMNDDPASPPLQALDDAGLIEQIGKATTIPGPTRTWKVIADQFADLNGSMWTHRHRAHGTTTFGLYDQIWTSPDLAVTAAHVMRRTQISGDGTDHDPASIDLTL
jgi:endonuclease/exonuclease/phosphatase family metal-dependent hydrolase